MVTTMEELFSNVAQWLQSCVPPSISPQLEEVAVPEWIPDISGLYDDTFSVRAFFLQLTRLVRTFWLEKDHVTANQDMQRQLRRLPVWIDTQRQLSSCHRDFLYDLLFVCESFILNFLLCQPLNYVFDIADGDEVDWALESDKELVFYLCKKVNPDLCEEENHILEVFDETNKTIKGWYNHYRGATQPWGSEFGLYVWAQEQDLPIYTFLSQLYYNGRDTRFWDANLLWCTPIRNAETQSA